MSNQCTFGLRGQGRFRDLMLTPQCTACDEAAKHANSDATTPGFFHDRCADHHLTGIGEPLVIPYEVWSTELWALLAGELNKQAERRRK